MAHRVSRDRGSVQVNYAILRNEFVHIWKELKFRINLYLSLQNNKLNIVIDPALTSSVNLGEINFNPFNKPKPF